MTFAQFRATLMFAASHSKPSSIAYSNWFINIAGMGMRAATGCTFKRSLFVPVN